jgi:cellulose 1,4-beta-cellobiosidase
MLLNQEFSFDVDVSELPCGLNGALYLVEMDADGGMSYPTNDCGAEFGTGYCDAQCPHDMKWINGEANCDDWNPSDNDVNAGTGHYGACCAEMDLWEANSMAHSYTTHPCEISGQYRCEGTECGDNAADERLVVSIYIYTYIKTVITLKYYPYPKI